LNISEEYRISLFELLSKFESELKYHRVLYQYIFNPNSEIESVPTFEYDFKLVQRYVDERLKGNEKIDYLNFLIYYVYYNNINDDFYKKLIELKKLILDNIIPFEADEVMSIHVKLILFINNGTKS
jgi:hypothetical protein